MNFKSLSSFSITGEAVNLFSKDKPKIIIIGASGWLGMSTLHLLQDILGDLNERVLCFGSVEKELKLLNRTSIKQYPLKELSLYPQNKADYLLNFAFLTRGKLDNLSSEDFIESNRIISTTIYKEARRIKVPNVATISSGAVYTEDNSIASDINKNPYGFLKHEEELLFSELKEYGAKVIIPRLFNITGPYSGLPNLYMITSLISQALNVGSITIDSDKKVFRSFISIADLISTIFGSTFLIKKGESIIYDTCGVSIEEVGDLALHIKRLLNSEADIIRPIIDEDSELNYYVGSRSRYGSLIHDLKIREDTIEDQIINTAEYLKLT